MRKLLLALFTLLTFSLFSQEDITTDTTQTVDLVSEPQFELTGFIDAYYSYDLGKPEQGFRQPFLFNHNRHNEFNINLALLEFSYETQNYHAFIGLQAGTYANDNYAAESSTLKNLSEAYVGIALDKEQKLWLDAGLFGSHLGFESAVSSDNWTLTRSLVAESSPFFLTGAKLTYDPNDQWTFLAVATNGWQRIARLPGNSMLSYGTQVQYHPSKNFTLNWSTFYGTDTPDANRYKRIFNNLYMVKQFSEKFGLTAGLDFGLQQFIVNDWFAPDGWIAPVLIGQYKVNDEWAVAMRAEVFRDYWEVIIPDAETLYGFSFNVDHEIEKDVHFRMETRWFNSPNKIFERPGNGFHGDNVFITASITAKFNK